jgi:polar amino acid transport system permease protein
MTVMLSVISLVLGTLIGFALGVLRTGGNPLISRAIGAWVDVIRGTPFLVQIFLIFFILPELGIELDAFTAGIIALTNLAACFICEIVVAGIRSVPTGQVEAAMSIGLTRTAVTRLVQLPQAVRTMLPTLVSQMVVLLKDSALGFIVAYPELLRSGRRIYTNVGNVIPTAIVIATIYIVINLALTTLATVLEGRFRAGRSSKRRRPSGGLAAPPVAADGGLSKL